ncbi:DUF3152 domain-containing protein [Streptomyces sp. NPDC048514]|uniref:DUF3152 domain-containing protein n=1 Tax=Streptomyces sp. NPDC048514 TaxID=3365564 RepID=UPI0037105B10
MGRHSRRGPAPKDDSADITARQARQRGARSGDRPDTPGRNGGPATASPRPEGAAPDTPRASRVPGAPGVPAAPATSRPSQAAYPGAPRLPDGTPARGVPLVDGTPTRGVPRAQDGTPAHGLPRLPDAGAARGGHPEQREAGGGWGAFGGPADAGAGTGVTLPRQRRAGPDGGPGPRPGPRQEYLEAFGTTNGGNANTSNSANSADTEDTGSAGVPAPRPGRVRRAEESPDAERRDGALAADGAGAPAQRGGGKGRAFAGIAAAAVTTVLAVVVAGQVADGRGGDAAQAQSDAGAGQAQGAHAPGVAPSVSPGAVTLTYGQKMGKTYPLGAELKGSGKFDAVPGFDKAPGKGQKYRYRVDVEQGLRLDGALFAEAVQKTLNDDRSWSHDGARTFERVSSGKPDFVITLASPGTTATWCAKSDLDTTEDNVSCDSAATERVMINAYRWAQGSETYGDKIYPYRQMLINHEVGHRLGHGHVSCQKDGELAPVMQQQTKFLDHDGVHCLPNPWPYPRS